MDTYTDAYGHDPRITYEVAGEGFRVAVTSLDDADALNRTRSALGRILHLLDDGSTLQRQAAKAKEGDEHV